MAYSGTLVVYGQASGIVVATGTATELGKINQMLSGIRALTTPLLRQIDRGRQAHRARADDDHRVHGRVLAAGSRRARPVFELQRLVIDAHGRHPLLNPAARAPAHAASPSRPGSSRAPARPSASTSSQPPRLAPCFLLIRIGTAPFRGARTPRFLIGVKSWIYE